MVIVYGMSLVWFPMRIRCDVDLPKGGSVGFTETTIIIIINTNQIRKYYLNIIIKTQHQVEFNASLFLFVTNRMRQSTDRKKEKETSFNQRVEEDLAVLVSMFYEVGRMR